MQDFIKINDNDNVVVALRTIQAGDQVQVSAGEKVAALEEIPQGHKMAIRDIPAGGEVIKYGYRIGNVKEDVRAGAWIHTHNLKTALGDLLEYVYEPVFPLREGGAGIPEECAPAGNTPGRESGAATFMGFPRPDGQVGVRNEIWIIPTVGCVNNVAAAIAKQANDKLASQADTADRGSVGEVIAFQAFLVPGRSEIINVRITDVVGFSKETVCTTIDDLLRQIIELLIGISHKPGIQNMIVVPAAVKAHQTKPH